MFWTGTASPCCPTQETIRIYVDDLSRPAYEGPLADLETGANAPFVPPLTTDNRGALVSYVPISYRSRLRIVLDDLLSPATVYYHQVDLRAADETAPFDVASLARVLGKGVTRLESSAKGTPGTSAWKDEKSTLAPGEELTVLDHAGAGTLKRMKLTLDTAALDHVRLRITWDSRSKPAVDAPLDVLFACRPTPATFTTLPMSAEVNGARATLTLSLPMPFSQNARVVLSNEGAEAYDVEARFDGVEGVPSDKWGYLHAIYNHRAAPDLGERYEVVNVEGAGKYVGTVLAMLGQTNPTTSLKDPFNFLEGDDLSVADGTPVTMGTGVEEYFDSGWYFVNGVFSAPFSAVVSVGPRAPDVPGQATAVRWSLLGDAIDFQHSFNLSFEYGANAPATAIDYSSVAFYYAQ